MPKRPDEVLKINDYVNAAVLPAQSTYQSYCQSLQHEDANNPLRVEILPFVRTRGQKTARSNSDSVELIARKDKKNSCKR
jgi:hypothetical protein